MKKIKKIIKYFFILLWGKNRDRIKSAIRKKEYVSFDMFDTLVVRMVDSPDKIFRLVGNRYAVETGECLENFEERRKTAERAARKELKEINTGKKKKREEITLEGIYQEFDTLSEAQKNALMKMECEEEYSNIVQNEKGRELYQYAVKLGKKIILTSDMYMPKDFLTAVLKKNGYDNFLNIYISSEAGLTKRTGNLFKKICYEEKCRPEELIHIGDSPISDGIGALKSKVPFMLLGAKR